MSCCATCHLYWTVLQPRYVEVVCVPPTSYYGRYIIWFSKSLANLQKIKTWTERDCLKNSPQFMITFLSIWNLLNLGKDGYRKWVPVVCKGVSAPLKYKKLKYCMYYWTASPCRKPALSLLQPQATTSEALKFILVKLCFMYYIN